MLKRVLLALVALSLAQPALAQTRISPKQISNGGTSNTTDFLRRDGTWAAPAAGGVTDGDKGDVTVSGSGNTFSIDNDVVTYGKIQNVSAASKLLGRGDSGSGDPQEITLGSGLSMTGTTLSASGGGSSTWTTTWKTSIETIQSDTTLSDDATLAATLGVGTYYVRFFVWYASVDAADFKYAFTCTCTTTSVNYIRRGSPQGASSGTDNESTLAGTGLISSFPTTSLASGNGWVFVDYIVTTSAGGSLKFQWAQNTSTASDTSVLPGSRVEIATVQ